MESLLKNLQNHVECSLCLDILTKPKTIACLHTFCCQCLKKHALSSQRDGQFRCPECQTQICIPEGNNFDQLPTSSYHTSLLNIFAVQQSCNGREVRCGICEKKSAECTYCFDCEKLMCNVCLNAHEMFRAVAFEEHKLTPVQQFKAADYEALTKRKDFCAVKSHEGEVMRFYCRDCETCICQVCVNTDHKNHATESLEKAAEVEKAKILAGTEKMKQKNLLCNNVVRKFEESAANFETDIAAAKHKVSEAAEQMIAAVREREREMITTLEDTRVSRKEKLDAAKKEAEELRKQLNQAAEYTSDLAQRSSSAHSMLRFQELSQVQLPELPVSSFVRFIPASEPDELSLGFIKTSETDEDEQPTENE